MSLKTVGLSIVIGSMFTGAKAFASSSYAITKLDASIKKLSDYKATLNFSTKEFAGVLKQNMYKNTCSKYNLHYKYCRNNQRIFFHFTVDMFSHNLTQIIFKCSWVLDEPLFHVD